MVVDTCVIVSAVIRPSSVPGWIVQALLMGKLKAYTSPALRAEYLEVLLRPKFGFDKKAVRHLVDSISAVTTDLFPMPQHVLSNDPKDQMVLDLAVGADAYLITGNVRHFSGYDKVLTPREAYDSILA